MFRKKFIEFFYSRFFYSQKSFRLFQNFFTTEVTNCEKRDISDNITKDTQKKDYEYIEKPQTSQKGAYYCHNRSFQNHDYKHGRIPNSFYVIKGLRIGKIYKMKHSALFVVILTYGRKKR